MILAWASPFKQHWHDNMKMIWSRWQMKKCIVIIITVPWEFQKPLAVGGSVYILSFSIYVTCTMTVYFMSFSAYMCLIWWLSIWCFFQYICDLYDGSIHVMVFQYVCDMYDDCLFYGSFFQYVWDMYDDCLFYGVFSSMYVTCTMTVYFMGFFSVCMWHVRWLFILWEFFCSMYVTCTMTVYFMFFFSIYVTCMMTVYIMFFSVYMWPLWWQCLPQKYRMASREHDVHRHVHRGSKALFIYCVPQPLRTFSVCSKKWARYTNRSKTLLESLIQ